MFFHEFHLPKIAFIISLFKAINKVNKKSVEQNNSTAYLLFITLDIGTI